MVKTTIIARVADGLPLAASLDEDYSDSTGSSYSQGQAEDLTEYKNQAKLLFKRLSLHGQEIEPRCSVETSGNYVFHYMIEFGICYLCLCDKMYPKKLAFAYLEELQKEFQEKYGNEVSMVARPYAFVKFDTTIQKLKKQYKDTRAQRNLHKLNEELQDVTRIMTKNIEDVLGRGESLDRMAGLSSNLSSASKKYYKDTKKLNLQLLYQKYGPPAIVILVVLFVLYIRYWW